MQGLGPHTLGASDGAPEGTSDAHGAGIERDTVAGLDALAAALPEPSEVRGTAESGRRPAGRPVVAAVAGRGWLWLALAGLAGLAGRALHDCPGGRCHSEVRSARRPTFAANAVRLRGDCGHICHSTPIGTATLRTVLFHHRTNERRTETQGMGPCSLHNGSVDHAEHLSGPIGVITVTHRTTETIISGKPFSDPPLGV